MFLPGCSGLKGSGRWRGPGWAPFFFPFLFFFFFFFSPGRGRFLGGKGSKELGAATADRLYCRTSLFFFFFLFFFLSPSEGWRCLFDGVPPSPPPPFLFFFFFFRGSGKASEADGKQVNVCLLLFFLFWWPNVESPTPRKGCRLALFPSFFFFFFSSVRCRRWDRRSSPWAGRFLVMAKGSTDLGAGSP